jgi:hypothetical protein
LAACESASEWMGMDGMDLMEGEAGRNAGPGFGLGIR